jgi:hypothetical protein
MQKMHQFSKKTVFIAELTIVIKEIFEFIKKNLFPFPEIQFDSFHFRFEDFSPCFQSQYYL